MNCMESLEVDVVWSVSKSLDEGRSVALSNSIICPAAASSTTRNTCDPGEPVPIPTPPVARIRNWSVALDVKATPVESAQTKAPSWLALAMRPAARLKSPRATLSDPPATVARYPLAVLLPPPATVEVEARDLWFKPAALTVSGSEHWTIRLKNAGRVVHNLTVDELGIVIVVTAGETSLSGVFR